MDRESINLLRISYNALLGRDPDPSAEADWAVTQKDGKSLHQLLNRILYSSEFAQRWRDIAIASEPSDWKRFFNEHSQFGEVALLLRLMINSASQHRLVVDVGANGRLRSNSFDLMRTFGWRGLLIEANPSRIPIIEAEFYGLDMQIVSCAVSDYTGTASLHLGTNDDVSSLSADATSNWGAVKGEVSVAVRPLAAILSEHKVPQDFDVLSVDAEGEDVRIINAALTDGYRPRWIIMETTTSEVEVDPRSLGLLEIVTENYRVAEATTANLIFVRKNR